MEGSKFLEYSRELLKQMDTISDSEGMCTIIIQRCGKKEFVDNKNGLVYYAANKNQVAFIVACPNEFKSQIEKFIDSLDLDE